ncbi:hypothetical protein CHARACLAT_026570 [Characodon lateralis]|uniref:Uncharacterized protein n=1 Tax=Characodon lateralis TaxID=208331 RepID=A0ABU7DA80_9TELE|nr:hypothetical protein [Characodon lateralis]
MIARKACTSSSCRQGRLHSLQDEHFVLIIATSSSQFSDPTTFAVLDVYSSNIEAFNLSYCPARLRSSLCKLVIIAVSSNGSKHLLRSLSAFSGKPLEYDLIWLKFFWV